MTEVLIASDANAAPRPRFASAVCALNEVSKIVKRGETTHLLSLIEPEKRTRRPKEIVAGRHFLVLCEDTEDRFGLNAPTMEQVSDILTFGRSLPNGASLLVHCYAGVSRSTAALLILLAQDLGPGHEKEAGRILMGLRDCALPNLLICEIADYLLERDGALYEVALDINEAGMQKKHGMPIRRTRRSGR